jgi:hypothetical protein
MTEGVARRLRSDFGSIDAGGEESGQLPGSPPRITSSKSVGTWPCACGQEYRVLTSPLTFWAQNSRRGYSSIPSTTCVWCGADLEESFALEAARLVSASIFS